MLFDYTSKNLLQTCLLWAFAVIEASEWIFFKKCKQTAESKQPAELIKILNIRSEHVCVDLFQCLKPLSGLNEKSK